MKIPNNLTSYTQGILIMIILPKEYSVEYSEYSLILPLVS